MNETTVIAIRLQHISSIVADRDHIGIVIVRQSNSVAKVVSIRGDRLGYMLSELREN